MSTSSDQSTHPRTLSQPSTLSDFLRLTQTLQTPRPQSNPKPSWVGPIPPPRAITPGVPNMKANVTVSYSQPGLQPPVFIVTSLSEPQWQPVELDFTKKDDGQFHFHKDFSAEEGEHQYKFRLGPGDWWAGRD